MMARHERAPGASASEHRSLLAVLGRTESVGTLRALVGDPAPGRFAVPVRVVRWPALQQPIVPIRARSVSLVATDADWLRRCVSSPLATVATRRAVVTVIAGTPPPWPGWSGRLGPLPGLVRHRVRRSARRRGRVVVEVALARQVPLSAVVGAVLDLFSPHTSAPAPVTADVAAYGVVPGWLPPSANVAAFAGPDPDDEKVSPYDILVTEPGTDRQRLFDGVSAVSADPSGVTAPRPTVMVDASTSNPRGYRAPVGTDPDGVLRVVDGGWKITTAAGVACAGSLEGSHLDHGQLAAIRGLRSVTCTGAGPDSGALDAALLVRLAMTGVVLTAPDLPSTTAALLAPELCTIMAEDPPAEPIEWEIRSVRQRREAMRRHATGLILSGAAGLQHALPTVSALLVVTDPDRLAGAIAAIQAQTYPQLEIVLGVRGSRHPGVGADVTRPVKVVEIPTGLTPGEALDEVTACAGGSLLTRFDEDDSYGSEHVWDLVLARHHSGAAVVGKASEFVFLTKLGVSVRRAGIASEAYATRVAGGTVLISRGDLDSVGGWRPLNPPVGHGLLDRVKRNGGLTYRAHSIGFVHTRRSEDIEPLPRHLGPQWTGLPPYREFA